MSKEAEVFSLLNTRLGKLEINYYSIRKVILKSKFKKLLSLSFLLVLVGVYSYFNFTYWIAVVGVSSVIILAMLVRFIKTCRYEPMQTNCNNLIHSYLDKPRFMAKLLKNGKKVYDESDCADIDISNVSEHDFKVLDKFIGRYKTVRQLLFLIPIAVVLGSLLSVYVKPFKSNIYLSYVNNVLGTALVMVCFYYILSAFSNLAYKVIFRNFNKTVNKYYRLGALGELHYKVLYLYYNNYLMEPMFDSDDYTYFVEENIISREEVVKDYIKELNFKRSRACYALGLVCGLAVSYVAQPLYAVGSLVLGYLIGLVVRIRFNKNNIVKYERKLLNDNSELTVKIMKQIPKDFLENL